MQAKLCDQDKPTKKQKKYKSKSNSKQIKFRWMKLKKKS